MPTQQIDFIVRMQNQAANSLRELGVDFQGVARRAMELQTALGSAGSSFEALDRRAETTAQRLGLVAGAMTAIGAASREMEAGLAASVHGLASLGEGIRASLEARTGGITRMARALGALSESTAGLGVANTEIARFGATITRLVEDVNRMTPSTREFQRNLSGMTRSMRATTQAAAGMGAGITELDRLSIAMERLAAASIAIVPVGAAFRSIRTAAGSMAGVDATLAALAASMHNLSMSTVGLQRVPVAFQTLVNDLRAQMAALRIVSRQLDDIFADGTMIAGRYANSLTSVITRLNQVAAAANRAASGMRAANAAMGHRGAGGHEGSPGGSSGHPGGVLAGAFGQGHSYALEHTERRVSGMHEGIAALTALVGVATGVESLMKFDEELAHISAITGKSKTELRDWAEAARYMGTTTEYSATQAGAALEQLARAGITGGEAIKALAPVLDLTRLSGQSFEDVTRELVQIMGDFRLKTEDLNGVTDILAVTTKHSLANMNDMVISFRYAGAASAEAGVSVNETAAALAVMANGGIKASQAGTGLRAVVLDLLNPTKRAKQAFSELGISIDEMDVSAQEKLNPGRGLLIVLEKLQKAGADLRQMNMIFGKPAIQASNLLIQGTASQNGGDPSKDVKTLQGQLAMNEDAVGRAAEIGTKWSDNMHTAWKRLEATFQEAALELGDAGVSGALRNVFDTSRGVLDVWMGIEQEGQNTNETFGKTARIVEDIAIGIGAALAASGVEKIFQMAAGFASWPIRIGVAVVSLWEMYDAEVTVGGKTFEIKDLFQALGETIDAAWAKVPSGDNLFGPIGRAIMDTIQQVLSFTNHVYGAMVGAGHAIYGVADIITRVLVDAIDRAIKRVEDLGDVFGKLVQGDFAGANAAAGAALQAKPGVDIQAELAKIRTQMQADFSKDYLGTAGHAIADSVSPGPGITGRAEELAREREVREEVEAEWRRMERERKAAEAHGGHRDSTFIGSNVTRGSGGDGGIGGNADSSGDAESVGTEKGTVDKKADVYAKALATLIPYVKKQNELNDAMERSTEALVLDNAKLEEYGYTREQITGAITAAKEALDRETDSYTKHMRQLSSDSNLIGMNADQKKIATNLLNQYNQSLSEHVRLTEDQMHAMAAAEAANETKSRASDLQRTLNAKDQEIDKEMVLARVRGENASVTKALLQLEYEAAQKGLTLDDAQIGKMRDKLTALGDLKKKEAEVGEASDIVFGNIEKGILGAVHGERAAFSKVLLGISDDALKSSMGSLFGKIKGGVNDSVMSALGIAAPKAEANPFKDVASKNRTMLTESNQLLAAIERNTEIMAGRASGSFGQGNQLPPSVEGGGAISGSDAQIHAISAAARARGIDPAYAVAAAGIESDFDPRNHNRRYGGLFATEHGQLLPESRQIAAGLDSMSGNRDWFQSKYGRVPTGPEQYLMHNQGQTGYSTLASGDRNQSLKEAYQQAGIPWGNIVGGNTPQSPGNLPWNSGLPRDETLTKGQFSDYWAQKVQAEMTAAANRLSGSADRLDHAASAIGNKAGGGSSVPNMNPSGDKAPTPYTGGTGTPDVPDGHALGGMILGPGGPRDDLILARLSNQEYVMNADATSYYGSAFMDQLNSKKLPKDLFSGLPAFADGGSVGGSVGGSFQSSVAGSSSPAQALYGAALDLSQAAQAVNLGGNYLTAGGQMILQGGTSRVQKTWQSQVPYASFSTSSSYNSGTPQADPWAQIGANSVMTLANAGANSFLDWWSGGSSGGPSGGEAPGGGTSGGGLGGWLSDQFSSTPSGSPSMGGGQFSNQSGVFSQPSYSSGMDNAAFSSGMDNAAFSSGMDNAAFSSGMDNVGASSADAVSSAASSASEAASSMGGGSYYSALASIAINLLSHLLASKPKVTREGTTNVSWSDANGNTLGGYTFDEERAKSLSQGLISQDTSTGSSLTHLVNNDNMLNPAMQALTNLNNPGGTSLVWDPGPLVRNQDGTIQHDARLAQWRPSFFGQNPYAAIGGSDAYEQAGNLIDWQPYTYHDGGIVGHPTNVMRSLSPSVWSGARRYHDGGPILGMDEVPIIAKRGERVLNTSDSALLAQSLGSQGNGINRDGSSPGAGGHAGSSGHTIYVNVNTPDAQSFKKSESQIGHEIGLSLNRATRRNG